MAGDRLYQQCFIYADKSVVKQLIWESDIISNNTEKFPKRDNGEIATPYFEDYIEPEKKITILGKMNDNQIKQDRLKRSREHFKKEVWDTIPKSEKKLYRDRGDLKK